MARGGPDYKASNSYYGQSLTDVGELAARIGSIDLLDRKGVVIYQEDFSNLLYPWKKSVAVTWDTDVVAETSFMNAAVVRFNPLVINPASTNITKQFQVIQLRKFGLECMFRLKYTAPNTPSYFYFAMAYTTGTRVHSFGLRINPATNNIEYNTMAGGFPSWVVLIPIIGIYYLAGASVFYNYLKMVINLETMMYDRYIFNSQGGSMAGLLPTDTASPLSPYIDVSIGATAFLAPEPVYVSNPILTMDEP